MRAEYDFSKAKRGQTAARYAEGTNVVLLDPDVREVFPDSAAVNEALRTLTRAIKATPAASTARRPRRRSGVTAA
jgi:hypothetical protein